MAKNKKLLCGTIHRGSKAYHIVAKSTFADFMAMTGISRDYVTEACYDKWIEFFKDKDENVLYMVEIDYRNGSKQLEPYPENLYRYRSHEDKKRQLEEYRLRNERVREESLAKRKKENDERLDEAAKFLYSFERRNTEWEHQTENVKNVYRDRVVVVGNLLKG